MTFLPIGTPVRMTEIAFKHRRETRNYRRTGVVVGLGRSPGVIRVLQAGRRHAEAWRMFYWEAMSTPEEIVEATIEAFKREL